ncbi:MAG: energy transducer TonB, partial [Gemmatimonadetes bacterium]|nr:energy transducer TonB [Gemmatimonadota bacterium]
RGALSRHGGREESTEGDSIFVVFPGAVEAVNAAVDAQRRFGEHSWPSGTSVRVRMGVHSGEAAYGTNGYVGIDVHRAARISSVAHGGQILLSASTAALVAKNLPVDVTLQTLGAHRLKDLSEAELLSQVVAPGLDRSFPPLRSLDSVHHNLPVQLTDFIGRGDELREVSHMVSENRLVTLTGVGGTGKTRLAMQLGAEVVEDFPDGVWVVVTERAPQPDLADAGPVGGREPDPGPDVDPAIAGIDPEVDPPGVRDGLSSGVPAGTAAVDSASVSPNNADVAPADPITPGVTDTTGTVAVLQPPDSALDDRPDDPEDPADEYRTAAEVDSPPEIQNDAEVLRAIREEYPSFLRDVGITGSVRVLFFLNAAGEVVNFELVGVIGSTRDTFIEPALRVADIMLWLPAMDDGVAVPVQFTFDIQFVL